MREMGSANEPDSKSKRLPAKRANALFLINLCLRIHYLCQINPFACFFMLCDKWHERCPPFGVKTLSPERKSQRRYYCFPHEEVYHLNRLFADIDSKFTSGEA